MFQASCTKLNWAEQPIVLRRIRHQILLCILQNHVAEHRRAADQMCFGRNLRVRSRMTDSSPCRFSRRSFSFAGNASDEIRATQLRSSLSKRPYSRIEVDAGSHQSRLYQCRVSVLPETRQFSVDNFPPMYEGRGYGLSRFVIDPGVCTEGDNDVIFHYEGFWCCEEISPVSAEWFEHMLPNSVWSNPSARVTRKHFCPIGLNPR